MPYSTTIDRYYDHEVEFKSRRDYGMNDFCARGFIFDNDNSYKMTMFHKILTVHEFYDAQSFLPFFNAIAIT